MNENDINLLGLCRKAGKLSVGHDSCKASVNSGKSKLIILSSDASERLFTEFEHMAALKHIPIFRIENTMEQINFAIGCKAGVIAINDKGFASTLLNKITQGRNNDI